MGTMFLTNEGLEDQSGRPRGGTAIFISAKLHREALDMAGRKAEGNVSRCALRNSTHVQLLIVI